MTSTEPTATTPSAAGFLITKEHRRFLEFAETVRRDRYIGVCYGPPGVGKTQSARRHTHWDAIAPYLNTRHRRRRRLS